MNICFVSQPNNHMYNISNANTHRIYYTSYTHIDAKFYFSKNNKNNTPTNVYATAEEVKIRFIKLVVAYDNND